MVVLQIVALGLAILLLAVTAWQEWDDRRRQGRLEDRQVWSRILSGKTWFDDSDESCV